MHLDPGQIVTIAVAVIAGAYTLRGQLASARASKDAAGATAAANVRIAELQAQIAGQELAQKEQAGTREEGAKIREELRLELDRERARSQQRESELLARIDAQQSRIDALEANLTALREAVERGDEERDGLRRQACVVVDCPRRLRPAGV